MAGFWEEKYLQDALLLGGTPDQLNGKALWECPSNIALIKYWGKKPMQLPLNPSVSFTLKESKTTMIVDFSTSRMHKKPHLQYFFKNQPGKIFEERIFQFLQRVLPYLPFIHHMELVIRSDSTFPHSAGIASSASSFGALALCLCTVEKTAFGTLKDEQEFLRKASFLARLGSGSACRSVFGGFSLWGKTETFSHSDDEVAVSINDMVHPVFHEYIDSILVIHSGIKQVSSSEGHRLMDEHPYGTARIVQANANVKNMLTILKNGDESGLISLAEEEALSLHAMMMTSKPGYLLLKPASIEVIDRIRRFRASTGLPVSFTLDAGANIHVLYPARIRSEISSFIWSELEVFCDAGRIIHDQVGTGPVKLS
jgi:diphosphomevalonate decarboxylase